MAISLTQACMSNNGQYPLLPKEQSTTPQSPHRVRLVSVVGWYDSNKSWWPILWQGLIPQICLGSLRIYLCPVLGTTLLGKKRNLLDNMTCGNIGSSFEAHIHYDRCFHIWNMWLYKQMQYRHMKLRKVFQYTWWRYNSNPLVRNRQRCCYFTS